MPRKGLSQVPYVALIEFRNLRDFYNKYTKSVIVVELHKKFRQHAPAQERHKRDASDFQKSSMGATLFEKSPRNYASWSPNRAQNGPNR